MKTLRLNRSGKRKQGYRLLPVTLLAFLLSLPLPAQQPDSLKGPDIRINVQTERDDRGNIIRYDSSYSYSWSSGGDSIQTIIDSLFQGHGFSSRHFWPFRPGMLMPDSLPGYIISPFDFEGDPFFYGFTDSTFFRQVEKFFEEMRKGFFPPHTLPGDSLMAPFFHRFPSFPEFPEFPPVPEVPEKEKHKKSDIIDI